MEMTSERTPRDRAWLDIIQNSLTTGEALTAQDVQERADVGDTTARAVLHGAEDTGLLERDSPQAHTYYPSLAFVMEFEDDDLRRLFRDVMADERRAEQ